MSKLTGKKAIITGASRGIGLAIAKAFAANGASQLLLVGRNANSLSSAVKNIKHSTSSCDINTYIGDIKERNSWVEIGKLMVRAPSIPSDLLPEV